MRSGAGQEEGRTARSGKFLVVAGLIAAVVGGVMTNAYTSVVGPILLIVGLGLFGTGLLMR